MDLRRLRVRLGNRWSAGQSNLLACFHFVWESWLGYEIKSCWTCLLFEILVYPRAEQTWSGVGWSNSNMCVAGLRAAAGRRRRVCPGDVRSVNTCFNQACCSVSVAAAPICAKKNFAYDFITRPTDADCGRAPGLNFERPCRLSFNCFIVCQQTINKEPFYAISNSCTIYVFCQQTGIGCNELSSGRSW